MEWFGHSIVLIYYYYDIVYLGGGSMEFVELKEQIAALMCRQATMERDWDSHATWMKEMYRKNTDQILDLIDQAGWVLQPKVQEPSQN